MLALRTIFPLISKNGKWVEIRLGIQKIIPKKRDWPIVQLSKNRKEFIDEVAGRRL